MGKKGQRERIQDPFEFEAWRRDTGGLSAATRGIWLDWIEELAHPVAGGRISALVSEWSRMGRCTETEAEQAIAELRKWGVANVKIRNRGQNDGQLVDISCRRIERAYKRKEEKRLCEERRRMRTACGQPVDGDADKTRKNAGPTVRKKDLRKALGKDRSISRNEEKDPETRSVSVSGETSTRETLPDPILPEHVWSFADVVRLAAAICGEADSRYTLNTFRKRWKEIGDRTFRAELDSFFAELRAGEIPQRKGRAFTARLMKLRDAVLIRQAAEASLASVAPAAVGNACRHCGDTGTIRNVPVPEGDFAEGGRRDLPCGFCATGQREMERAGMTSDQQQELVRHEMAALRVSPDEFSVMT